MTKKYKHISLALTFVSTLIMTGCGGGSGDSNDGNNGGANSSGIIINEIAAKNTKLFDPDFTLAGDWIELKNTTASAISLSGYGLSNKKSEILWKFPASATLPANGYLVVWADKKDVTQKALHTNFNLSAKGDNVVLFSPNGTQLSEVTFKTQRPDITWARNGNGDFVLTAQPTQGTANTIDAKAISAKPTFSKAEGVYPSAISLTLTAPAGANIYYTTDGSDATVASTLYTNPLTIQPGDRNGKTQVKAVSQENGADKLLSKQRSRWYVFSTSPLHITEVLPDNNSTKALNGQFGSDVIELQNTSGSSLTITNYGLSDSMKKVSWKFPNITMAAGEKLLVWANDKNTTTVPYQTDFKLSSKGDTVALYNTLGRVIDFVKFDKIEKDMSWNREQNGSYTAKTPTLN